MNLRIKQDAFFVVVIFLKIVGAQVLEAVVKIS